MNAPDIIDRCRHYAQVIKRRLIAVDEDWRPGDPESWEPRETLLEAAQTIADLREQISKLADPNVVHLNMLRGGIARPSWEQIKHLYPKEFAADTEADHGEPK